MYHILKINQFSPSPGEKNHFSLNSFTRCIKSVNSCLFPARLVQADSRQNRKYPVRGIGIYMLVTYNMRINPPSNSNVNTIHHQEQLRTFVNFKITKINVSIFDSFLTHYDYIPIRQILQQIIFLKTDRKTCNEKYLVLGTNFNYNENI